MSSDVADAPWEASSAELHEPEARDPLRSGSRRRETVLALAFFSGVVSVQGAWFGALVWAIARVL